MARSRRGRPAESTSRVRLRVHGGGPVAVSSMENCRAYPRPRAWPSAASTQAAGGAGRGRAERHTAGRHRREVGRTRPLGATGARGARGGAEARERHKPWMRSHDEKG
jgi:hypothetical protein